MLYKMLLGCLAIMIACTCCVLFGKKAYYQAGFAFFPLIFAICLAYW